MIDFFRDILINKTTFAKLALESVNHFSNCRFEKIEAWRYPELFSQDSISKKYIADYKLAFLLLQIQSVITADVIVLDIYSYSLDDWEICFDTIKRNYFAKPKVQFMESTEFLDTAISYLEDIGGYAPGQIEEYRTRYADATVIELADIYAGHYCFGETKDEYFLVEFGCGYD